MPAAGGSVSLPASFTVELPGSVTGPVSVMVQALDGYSTIIAEGTATQRDLNVGGQTILVVTITAIGGITITQPDAGGSIDASDAGASDAAASDGDGFRRRRAAPIRAPGTATGTENHDPGAACGGRGRRRVRRLALAAAPPHHRRKDEIAARLPLTADEAAGLDAAPGAVPRRHHALLLLADRSRAPVLPGAHAGHPARARAGERAGRARRSAGRGQPLAGDRDLPPLSRPLPAAGARSLRDLLPPLQPAAPGRAARSRRSRAAISTQALDYIRRTPAIRDVLISGGDPLTLSTARLEEIIAALRAIPHVEIIRIGTRVPGRAAHAHRRRAVRDAEEVPPALHQHALQPPQGADAAARAPRARSWPTPASRSATRRCCCAA